MQDKALKPPKSINRLKNLLLRKISDANGHEIPEYLIKSLKDLIYMDEKPPLQQWIDKVAELELRIVKMEQSIGLLKGFTGS